MRIANLSQRPVVVGVVLFAAVLGAFLAGRALAGGIPASGAMTYAGTLQDASGAALTGDHNIEVKLWLMVSGGTNPLCATGQQLVTLDGGRFSVALADDCTTAVKANSDTWADVLVDGASLGRTKLGAVPYAVEAGHAVSADSANTAASANGALDSRIAAIENGLPGKSAFHARRSGAQAFASGVLGTIQFDVEDFDLGNEFANGSYTVQAAGYYDITCSTEWNIPSAGSATGFFEVDIAVNGTRRAYAGWATDGYYTMRTVHDLFKLAANDAVTCVTYQGTGAMQSLATDATQFSGYRVSP